MGVKGGILADDIDNHPYLLQKLDLIRKQASVAMGITNNLELVSVVDPDSVTIGHNSGKLLVDANFDQGGNVTEATVFRTARRTMEVIVYWA